MSDTPNVLSEKLAEANSYLSGCSKHGKWRGMSCIGCMEAELEKAQQTITVLTQFINNEMQMTATDPRVIKLATQMPVESVRLLEPTPIINKDTDPHAEIKAAYKAGNRNRA